MLTLTPDDIAVAGGLLAAMSAKSMAYFDSLVDHAKTRMPAAARDVNRIVTHAAPHLDEYFASLFFKSLLPVGARNLPLHEAVLSSRHNDPLAHALWSDAAVFGIGHRESGGAQGRIVFDEHCFSDEVRKASSCSELTINRLMAGGVGAIPSTMFWIFREVDHLDANGGAHPLHLGNAIKRLHDIDFTLHVGATPLETVSDRLSAPWKQALVEAAAVSMLYTLENGVDVTRKDVWQPTVRDLIRHYAESTLLGSDESFERSLGRLKSMTLGFTGQEWLSIKLPNGKTQPLLTKNQRKIQQRLVLPWLAQSCLECWGPQLAYIIMSHFWEASMMSDISVARVQTELEKHIGDGHSDCTTDTPAGELQFKSLRSLTVRPPVPKGSGSVPTWIIIFKPRPGIVSAKQAIARYISQRNGGVGLSAIVSPGTGTTLLSRSQALPDELWQGLTKRLLEREGDSADRDVAGCWYLLVNEGGRIADFLLNGNKAHQYVPRTALRDVDSLSQLLVDVAASCR